jgi:hypothetical protein
MLGSAKKTSIPRVCGFVHILSWLFCIEVPISICVGTTMTRELFQMQRVAKIVLLSELASA